MGSFGEGDHGKNDNPHLSWVDRGIQRHNAACRARAAATPLRLKILAALGITGPYFRWQEREPLYLYYPAKSNDAGRASAAQVDGEEVKLS